MVLVTAPVDLQGRCSAIIAESSATGWEDKQPKCNKVEHGGGGGLICNCWIIKGVVVSLVVCNTSN